MHVGNFVYVNKEIRLGDLSGNRFELVIRNIDRTDEELQPVLEAFKETGFINYFGMQRQEADMALVFALISQRNDIVCFRY